MRQPVAQSRTIMTLPLFYRILRAGCLFSELQSGPFNFRFSKVCQDKMQVCVKVLYFLLYFIHFLLVPIRERKKVRMLRMPDASLFRVPASKRPFDSMFGSVIAGYKLKYVQRHTCKINRVYTGCILYFLFRHLLFIFIHLQPFR